MEAKLAGVLDALLTQEHVAIMIAAYTLVKLFGEIPAIKGSTLAQRLKPGAAMFWCILGKYGYAMYCAEGFASLNHGELVTMGVVLGNAASHGHRLLKGTIFHGADEAPVGERDSKTGRRKAPSAYKLAKHKAKKLIT